MQNFGIEVVQFTISLFRGFSPVLTDAPRRQAPINTCKCAKVHVLFSLFALEYLVVFISYYLIFIFICLLNNEVLELYKSVAMSSEPIDDIQLTRPSFFISPSHVQVSLHTTAGFLWLYNFLVALEQNLSQKANDFVSKRFSMT